MEQDVTNLDYINVDFVWHLASTASPFMYTKKPIECSYTNFLGTFNANDWQIL